MWALAVLTVLLMAIPGHTMPDHIPDDVEAYLIFSSQYRIVRFNVDVTDSKVLQQDTHDTVALDFDYEAGLFYWSDQDDKKIYRAPLDGGNKEVVVSTGDDSQVDGVAVDWVNNQLYWTDLAFGTISRLNLNGFTDLSVVIATNAGNPRGIVLDPRNDVMYFTNVNNWAPNIQRARMSNGTQQQVIVSRNLLKPNAITMDYDTDRLYFADAWTDRIESCNVDGSDRTVLLNRRFYFHPFDLTLYDDRIYWTDLYQHTIVSAHKDTGGDRIFISGPFVFPHVIHAVHPSRQLSHAPNYCEANGGRGMCESNCTAFSTGYSCSCNSGYALNDDLLTCSDINECGIDNGGCSHHCNNMEGTFQCQCIDGFALLPDGVTCADNNECNNNRGGCEYACHNTDSGYYCSCSNGYELRSDQRTCQDINECLPTSPCPVEAQCINQDGSYRCMCPNGYIYDTMNGICADVDECLAGQGTCTQRCDNQPGSFSCSCHDGFVLDGDGVSCSDVNECEDSLHACQQNCVNIIGSFVCLCNDGFQPVGDGQSCIAIDCGQPGSIDGFNMSCTGTTYGSRCSLSCIQGTRIGSSTIICQQNGVWSVSTAECIATEDTEGVNDPPLAIVPSSFSIPEDTVNGTVLGMLHTVDPDNHQSYTYTLTSDPSGKFYIDTSGDTLKTHGGFDYETDPAYTIHVTSVDSGTPPLSGTFDLSISILDVNETPRKPTLTSNTIGEHAAVGDQVGTILASDPDQGQDQTFSLLSSGHGKFDIQGDQLLVAGSLNFEHVNTYSVVVQVEDSGSPRLSNVMTFAIMVQDENDAPTAVRLSATAIPETSPDSATAVGTVIGVLTTNDEDRGDSHTYTLQGPLSSCFSISNSDLTVAETSCFDHEINPSIPLNITSTDSAGLTIQHMFTISVTDVNDPPFGILLSSSTVQEHIAVNTIVGTLTVEDPDQGDTHQLSIVTGGSLFAVHGNALVVSADLSYTDYPTGITVAIQATDTGNQSYIEMFSISVQNVNEPPNDINWQVTARCTPEEESITGVSIHACVTENTAPDTLIATAVVTDPDFDTVSLQIIDSANIFVLDQSGALKVGQQGLNFESPLVGEVHSVFVVAEDPGRLTSTSQFTVKIINENDPPTRVEISRTFVGASTAIGQSAAVLQCIDEDATDTHTFSLVNNTENMFAIVGNELRVQQDLSALAGNQFAIEVQCSDGAAELMTPATFVITVYRDSASGGSGSAINISLSHSSISEQQPANTLVGTLSAEIMPTSLFNFTIVGGASRLFSIQPGVGGNPPELRTTQPLDFEEASMHYVIIRAETGENSAVKTFLITVLDVNEPPGSLTFHYSPVHENQQGALVGIVSAIDPDEGDTVTFQILNDPSSAFDLQDGATLNSKRVVTRRAVDFEMETSLSLVLAARDPHALAQVSESPEYIIQVLNINEAPTDILISQAAIDENRAQGTVIGTLSVIDPDTPRTQQHFICSLQDSAQGLFRLNGFDIEVLQSQRLDYEIFAASGKMPTVVVECSDDGSLSVSRHFEITVRDVAEQPYDIQSATGVYEIMENNEAGAVIAHLNTLDPDTVDQSTFLYTVSDRDTFEIVGNMLIAQIQLNYERRRFYDIQITTTDADGLSFTEGVTVTVLDGNDPPTGIVMTQISTLSADSPSGMVIATLDAIDEDRAQQHQFNIQTQTPGGALQITSGNKLAVANGTLHEHSVQVTFVVRDLNGVTLLIHVQTFTISVLGVNLSPTDIQLTGSSVLEGSVVGTVVGNIQVQDPSDSDQRFYCTLLDDAGGRFDIVNFGGEIQLQVAYSEGLDFETASSHSIRISCRDSLPQNTIEKTFVIDVLDGPERPTGIVFTNAADDDTTTNVNPPNLSNFQGHVITLPIATIREDAQDGIGIVAYVTVIAADGTPASDQSALVSSLISENEYNRLNRLGRRKRAALRLHARSKREAGNVPFVIPEIGQYILVSGALDHETQREYMLYVKASYRDTPNLVVTGQLRVVVFDVDEAPLDMSLSPIMVSEGALIDTQVGQLSINDPDGTQTAYVYTMISLGTPFYIQQHRVLVQRLLDHETTPIITIQVKVAELNTNLELVKNFDIGITDTPEPPTALTVDGNTTLTIPETLNVGESLGNFVVTDPDTAGGFAFSFFVDEDSHSFFSISGDQLLLARRLDAWTTNVLSLFIQVTDPTYLSFRQVITVRVTSDDRCSQPGYCSPYATCLRGFCTCKAGFTGDGFTCSDIDECTPFPCHVLHSIPGQCVNGFGGIRNFSCSCLPGWSGRDCTMEVDSCQQNQCSPLGTVKCVNVANTVRYTCECKRGFEGPLCDGDADDCADHQCQNGAKCIDGVGIYTCQCVAPYEGYFCELDPRLCDGAKCAYNGSCIPLPNGQHECRCSDPILSDCSGCAFGYGGENCKPCDPPFTGQNCDIDSRICDPNPCTYGGVCIPDVDKYSCVCPENLATKECTPRVVPLGTGNDNGTDHGTFPIWTVIVIVLVLVAIVIGMGFLMVRRYRRVPYKGSDPFVPWRARFRSDSEQVMVTPDQDHRTQHHPSMDFIPEDYQTQDNPPQDYPPVDYAERDYPMDGNEEAKVQVASSVPTPTEAVAKASTPEAPAAVSTGAEALPTAAKAEDTKQIPKDKPPPYSPPDNLFLASALGLLPPGYEVKGQQVDINSGKEKQEKAQMGGDLAVAQFMETLAMPLSDRGTLQAKGSNLDQWEQAQLGLVKENVPEQGDKRVRKKSAGRRPSVTRKHSVGAVAYQNPIFIPENPVLSKQAATEMRQDGESSVGAVQPPSQSSPQSVSGNRKTSTSATLNGNHDDITEDQNRSNKLSLTKSPSDITKQNPIFQDSDNEDLDDDPFE
ncbi:protocadherin Fat 4-like [Acanthaster planci]|uniref:Protocadherin Fat 4-like n=1 Tax=Acanthaster planci TaxID=133434 RepID=A0A8B7YZW4_ACAPL|nr:protocadherin Fat 4-like [Acanthaster planci]